MHKITEAEINVFKLIDKLKQNIAEAGLKKTGKSNFGSSHSEAELIKTVREHSPEGLIWQFIPPSQLDYKTASPHVLTCAGEYVVIDTNTNSYVEFPVPGIGIDRNDASFAYGKSQTYAKRIALCKILDIPNEDMDPENPKQMKSELITAINTIFKENEKIMVELQTQWLNKYKSALNLNKLDVDKLQNLYNQISQGAQ